MPIPAEKTSRAPGFKKCVVESCQGNCKASGGAKGYCAAHYKRLKRGVSQEGLLAPIVSHEGHVQVSASVSLHAWDAVADFAQAEGLSIYEATRRVLEQEIPKYRKGLPDRVNIPRGDSSNILSTEVVIETLVDLTSIGRLTGTKTRGYVAQQIFERFGMRTATKNRHQSCVACQAVHAANTKK